MDNFSHSVAGLAAGELIHRTLKPEGDQERNRTRHRLLLLTCWLASNFPDLDLFLTPLLPEPLGYLLHHRGHTHTLLYALPQALLLSVMVWLCWPAARRLLRGSSNARKGFMLALAAGFGLHLGMDYLNSYGIHPFHPFDSRWLYGDMVFILEPFFWIAFGVPLAMMVARRWVRGLLLAVLIGVPLYFTLTAYLAWTAFGLLVISAAALAIVQQRADPHGTGGLIFAGLLALVFVGVQASASGQVRRIVEQQLQARDPASRVLDVSLSSFPTNPLCWTFASIESNEDAGRYRVRRGLVSLASTIMPVAACPSSMAGRIGPGPRDATPAIAYSYEASGDLHLLRRLKADNCHVAAWLRFARVPLVTDGQASDMRFSAEPADNFTSMRWPDFAGSRCSSAIPGWDFPRADLLTP